MSYKGLLVKWCDVKTYGPRDEQFFKERRLRGSTVPYRAHQPLGTLSPT